MYALCNRILGSRTCLPILKDANLRYNSLEFLE